MKLQAHKFEHKAGRCNTLHPLTQTCYDTKNDEGNKWKRKQQKKLYVYYHSCTALAMQHSYWLHYHKNKQLKYWFQAVKHIHRWFKKNDIVANGKFIMILCSLNFFFLSITLCKYLWLHPVVSQFFTRHWISARLNKRKIGRTQYLNVSHMKYRTYMFTLNERNKQ